MTPWNCIICGGVGLTSPDHVCVETVVDTTPNK